MGKNTDKVQNCYYSDRTAGIGSGDGDAIIKTAEQFASGEVAWLLRTKAASGTNGDIWGQKLGVDSVPVLDGGKTVCQVTFDDGSDETENVCRYVNKGGTISDIPVAPEGCEWQYGNEEFTSSTTVTGDITVTAVEKTENGGGTGNNSGGGNSGGGYNGGGGSSATGSVTVNNPDTANGTVSSNTATAKKGDKVTISSKADSGYISSAPTVTDKNGNAVDVVENADGTYSFIMPEGGVTVTGNYVTPGQMFSDVSDSAWYRESIAYAVEKGLMQGVGGQRFNPSGATTRGMVMTILARQFGIDTTPTGSEVWYQKGMDWAKQAGVSDGSDPGGSISREQLATMLWRFAGEPVVTGDLSVYPDASDIHADWAGSAMIWAVQTGIIQGTDGKLNPRGDATRAEAAAMLMRFLELDK